MAVADIQTSLAAGELSPQLYARVDLDKFQVGAALLRNYYVDYRGGVSNRAGTEFIDVVVDKGSRLIPFVVSTSAAYVLVFSNELITVYNQGVFVTTVATPYQTADLFTIAYTQSADVLTLVHPSYPPADLSRIDDGTFSYDLIVTGPDIDAPTITTMVAPHSGPYSFGYLVTAVDLSGKEESLPSNPGVKHSEGMNELTNRVVGLSWNPPAQGVARYNAYKWGPIDSVTLNPATVWGFIGSSQTTTFTDNNIAPDFSKQPPGWGDPFSGGQFESIVVNNGGSGYDGVSGDWPTAVPYVPLTITGDGTAAAGYAVIDHATGKIIGVYLTNPGKNYTNATVTANGQGGTGATFTFTFTDINALNPAATAYLQQRRVFGGSNLKPEALVMSQPGLITNFNTTPVTLADDSIVMSIAAEQVNTIKSFVQVNYGLLAFTTGGSFLINGGTPGAAIDANSPSVQPQVSQGANDLRPLRINYDVLYGQAKGNRIHNLAFAWQKQSYAGGDISTLAAHLFDTFLTTDWTYAEEPFKIVWAVRDDGKLLSLTYVPEQEVYAWCRHDTQGLFRSTCSVPEGDVDAVYFIVERYIPALNPDPTDPSGNWFCYLERMAERQGCCIFDAWFLDCALSLSKPTPPDTLYLSGTTGTVTVTSTGRTGGRIPDITGLLRYSTFVGSTWNGDESCVDWATGRALLFSNGSGNIESFDFINNATVAHRASTGLSGWISRAGEPGDAHFYPLQLSGNGGILNKLNETTLAVVSTFGVFSLFVNPTDATQWAFPADYDLFSNSSTNFLISFTNNPSQLNNEVTVLNVDTMAWTGFNFHADEPKCSVCRGLPVGSEAQAYVLGFDDPGVTLGLYVVQANTVLCTMRKISDTRASLIPGWTHVTTVGGICLDEYDDNIIAMLGKASLPAYSSGTNYDIGTLISSAGHDYSSLQHPNTGHTPATSPTFWKDLGASGSDENRLVKFSTINGSVLWSVVIGSIFSSTSNWSDQKISHGTLCYLDPAGSTSRIFHVINTTDGTEQQFTVNRITSPGGMQSYNDTTGVLVFNGTFDVSAGAAPPSALGSTPTSYNTTFSTFGPAPPPPTVGPFTHTGILQIGCGKISITTLNSSTSASGTVIADLDDILIPDDPAGAVLPIDPGDWTFTTPVTVLSGLDHLEGKVVWALADGVVEGPLTVTGGSVALSAPATNIVVGLRYTQQLQTLYLTTQGIQDGSDQGKRKQITGVTVRTDCTRGLKAGTDFAYLTPVPELNEDLPANELYTGDARVLSFPQWDRPGQVCIQQDDPLPSTILGVIVEVTPGDTGS